MGRHRSVVAPALTLLLACGGAESPAGRGAAEPGADAAEAVRAAYGAADITAAGAWVWEGPLGITFVLVDAQSAIEGIVQGRADLWVVTDSGAAPVGRSEVMPSVAEIGAFAFEDLTGDGFPDLFGWVADSAGVRYPVFLVGASGGLREEIAIAATGWVFESEPDGERVPDVLPGPSRACALRLWALDPAPDRGGEGWRFVPVLPDGRLGAPRREPPDCR
jgi:hypothetical protein